MWNFGRKRRFGLAMPGAAPVCSLFPPHEPYRPEVRELARSATTLLPVQK